MDEEAGGGEEGDNEGEPPDFQGKVARVAPSSHVPSIAMPGAGSSGLDVLGAAVPVAMGQVAVRGGGTRGAGGGRG
eukprot:scaffold57905_cov19-Tisochrysis_lutea.AAC.1